MQCSVSWCHEYPVKSQLPIIVAAFLLIVSLACFINYHLRVGIEVSVSVTVSMMVVDGGVGWRWDDLRLAAIGQAMVMMLTTIVVIAS